VEDGIIGPKAGIDRPVTLSDSIMLEFSNYAHVELKRRGAGMTKRYEYEYWGTKYQWKRESRRDGDLREVSYHLINMRTSKRVAHIMPEILTPLEAIGEAGSLLPLCGSAMPLPIETCMMLPSKYPTF
jgi:hypothetical protein